MQVAVRNLVVELIKRDGCGQHKVFSFQDRYTKDASDTWKGVDLTLFEPQFYSPAGWSRKMGRELQNFLPDVVHQHGIWQLFSLQVKGFPCRVISPHGMLDSHALKYGRIKKTVARWLYENKNLSGASCIHALCESEYRAIRDAGLENPVAVIPNGVRLTMTGNTSLYWEQFSKGRRVLLFLGRLHPKKGLEDLLQAWADVVDRSEGWCLVIAGWQEAGYGDYLKKIMEKNRLEGSVLFPGPLYDEEKVSGMRSADAFVLPSYSEGLPMAVLEAWASKLPVFMTQACNLPSGFERNAAEPIEVGREGVKAGLLRLFKMSRGELDKIGQSGQKLVSEQFSWERVGDEMFRVYEWLLGGGRKPDTVRLN